MKSKRNVFEEARRSSCKAIKNAPTSALGVFDKVFDECIMAMNRIAIQERTWSTDYMCIERRCEFFAYFEILKKFFPGMEPADVLEVIKVE